MTRWVRFFKKIHNKKTDEITEVDEHPPKWCIDAVSESGTWSNIRSPRSVISSPTFLSDGRILSDAGYDEHSGLLLTKSMDLDIPDCPRLEDAKAAVETILDVVCDFPFSRDEHRASWLAYLLTAFSRHAFFGPCPLFLIDANLAGSGKSKLADIVSIIATGRDAPRLANSEEDDECRKKITSLVMKGDLLAIIDNISGQFGCASLDSALTGTVWHDRVLGGNETITLPLLIVWAATGNNVTIGADTTRRVSHIRLTTKLENPEQRSGFRYPNVLQHVADCRVELVRAALTILRAFHIAGRPDQGLKPWGSFEEWTRLVRNAVVWAGQPDPGSTREELSKEADVMGGAIRDLLHGWNEIDPTGEGLTAADLLDILGRDENRFHLVRGAIGELCGGSSIKLPSVKSVGSRFRTIRQRREWSVSRIEKRQK